MSGNPNNPYAAPQTEVAAVKEKFADPKTMKLIEAIIKDADQFWIAILMCVFCTGLGAIVIGPWYLVRLMQWGALSRSHPMLLDGNVPSASIAQRFQSARTKLIIGLSVGALVFLGLMSFVAVAMVSG